METRRPRPEMEKLPEPAAEQPIADTQELVDGQPPHPLAEGLSPQERDGEDIDPEFDSWDEEG